MDISAAPQTLSLSYYSCQKMNDQIKKFCQKILEKYFENREYNKQKIVIWKDYAFEDISNFLNKRYYDYGFIITFTAARLGNIIETRQINRYNDDNYISVSVETDTMMCILNVIYYKNETLDFYYYKEINEETLLKMK